MIIPNLVWHDNSPVNRQVDSHSELIQSGQAVHRSLYTLLPYRNFTKSPPVCDPESAALVIFVPFSLTHNAMDLHHSNINKNKQNKETINFINLTINSRNLHLFEKDDDQSLLPALALEIDVILIRYRSIQHLWNLCLRSMKQTERFSSSVFNTGDGIWQWWLERRCNESNVPLSDLVLQQTEVMEWIKDKIRVHYLGGRCKHTLHELMDFQFFKL